MSAVAVSSDGQTIFVALESAGNPVVVRTSFTALGGFTTAYSSGSGTAINVKAGPGGVIFFYGNMGTNVTVIRYTVATGTEEDISPPGLGANVVNGLDVNPANADEIWITVNGNQDLLRTVDGGDNWTTINAALGITPSAIKVLWPDSTKILVAGSDGTDTVLLYTEDQGTTFTGVAETEGLVDAANIAALGVQLIDGSVL